MMINFTKNIESVFSTESIPGSIKISSKKTKESVVSLSLYLTSLCYDDMMKYTKIDFQDHVEMLTLFSRRIEDKNMCEFSLVDSAKFIFAMLKDGLINKELKITKNGEEFTQLLLDQLRLNVVLAKTLFKYEEIKRDETFLHLLHREYWGTDVLNEHVNVQKRDLSFDNNIKEIKEYFRKYQK